jgi:hypothetical protein
MGTTHWEIGEKLFGIWVKALKVWIKQRKRILDNLRVKIEAKIMHGRAAEWKIEINSCTKWLYYSIEI